MLHGLLLLLLWSPSSSRFWEVKEPEKWTAIEIDQLLSNSPWARSDVVPLYLASAKPIAEIELRRPDKASNSPEGALIEEDDYRLYMKETPGKHLVLAVRLPDPNALSDAAESRRMEKDCVLKVGRKKYKMVGHFPPTPRDPVLRLLFPRVVDSTVKSFSFELYLPSVTQPYRMFEFFTKEMIYRGKLEY